MSGRGNSSFFPDYSLRDYEIVDYQFHELPSHPGLAFRGPKMADADLAGGNYFSVIGGAQAVGVYVEKPYPQLLAEKTGIASLNLGLGGAGPEFYAQDDALLALVNAGRFLVLQVMTARTAENSRLRPVGVELVEDRVSGATETTVAAWERLLREDREQLPRYVAESLASWKAAYRRLIAKVTVPVIYFNFSYKSAAEVINYDARDRDELMGTFPQLVDRESISEVARDCDFYVECDSKRNFGHVLHSRFTGEPVTVDFGVLHPSIPRTVHTTNTYYPSAEMHEDASEALLQCLHRNAEVLAP